MDRLPEEVNELAPATIPWRLLLVCDGRGGGQTQDIVKKPKYILNLGHFRPQHILVASKCMKTKGVGHLLKAVELVEDKIPFFWHPSTENERLRRLQITFYKSPFF